MDAEQQQLSAQSTDATMASLCTTQTEAVIAKLKKIYKPSVPYRGLERFGVAFLNRFEGSMMPNAMLQKITLVDTPGILAREKQRLNRGYDFTEVVKWFAERADLIIILFDAHKLDISDELKNAIDALKGHEKKNRCILNKADQISRQKLMRV